MRRAEENQISVEINRFNMEPMEVYVDEDATVGAALSKAGIDVSASETIWVNGEKATTNDLLDDGDTIQLVGKKEGGLK